ncbi:hypothetical protein QJQ58_09640 [Paenibacillus dendritiformis]|uniref:hypothetical protein n=1 Tax=Paenibacillus dendritiformis TaxID=130049 RepID=UPI00248CE4F7|nr:hypothetical protein [Paenibacillus dendritiformis]WGU96468.1 hypothetical protein QJQ58_09640 [Paenibacillus dendritiformis]
MSLSKSSDLSMNWAIDQKTNKKRSAREVHNNQHLKEPHRYICIGCEELPKHLISAKESQKEKTVLEHVGDDEHPYFRKGKLQQHYERCRFRSPDSRVFSLAKANGIPFDNRTKVLRILTSAKLIRKMGDTLGYSRRAYAKFFTQHAHRKFYFFLSSLIKDYEITTFKERVSDFKVETESGAPVNFADMFGLQDDIINQLEKYSFDFLAVVVGTVRKITHKGHIMIDFSTSRDASRRNSKPFRLFVHHDYAAKVGNVMLLENQKIACYGFAEKKILSHGTVYQMELYSIEHQIHFFENPPDRERVGSITEPDDPVDFALHECSGFVSRFWGAERLSAQVIKDLLTVHGELKLAQLKADLVKEEAKQSTFEAFITSWNKLQLQIENDKQQLKQLHLNMQHVAAALRNESAKISSKFGFNRKALRTLEDELNRIQQQLQEIERVLHANQGKFQQNNEKKRQWDEWKQSFDKRKQDIERAERSTIIETKHKGIASAFNPFLFRIPFHHPRWELFLGFHCSVEEESRGAVMRAIIQLYTARGQTWLPADHPLQERVIDHQFSIDQLNMSPRDAMKGFYSKLGKAVYEYLQLMGWPVSKCKCPKCQGSMRLQFRNEQHVFVCWDSKCKNGYELKWQK